jgi:hypothetical protein
MTAANITFEEISADRSWSVDEDRLWSPYWTERALYHIMIVVTQTGYIPCCLLLPRR